MRDYKSCNQGFWSKEKLMQSKVFFSWRIIKHVNYCNNLALGDVKNITKTTIHMLWCYLVYIDDRLENNEFFSSSF